MQKKYFNVALINFLNPLYSLVYKAINAISFYNKEKANLILFI